MTEILSCTQIKSVLSAYFDGELSSEEKKLVENHLGYCDDCKKELECIQKVSACVKNYFINSTENVIIPESCKENVLCKTDFFQIQRRIIYSAAALALLALITYLSINLLNSSQTIHEVKFKQNQNVIQNKGQLVPLSETKTH